jgi:hypothetical protein
MWQAESCDGTTDVLSHDPNVIKEDEYIENELEIP